VSHVMDPDHGDARLPDVHFLGRRLRKVEDPAFNKGPTVGNSYEYRVSGLYVDHADNRTQRKRSMGRGHGVHVVDFAIRTTPVVIWASIPTGEARLH